MRGEDAARRGRRPARLTHDVDFVEMQFLYPINFDADSVGSPCAVFNLHAF